MDVDAVLVFDADGTTRHLVDPLSERIAAAVGPRVSTQRCSHIETWGDLSIAARQWLLDHRALFADIEDDRVYELEDDGCDLTTCFWADLLPVNGPVLGPFEHAEDANKAEIKYLQERDLPCPLETPLP